VGDFGTDIRSKVILGCARVRLLCVLMGRPWHRKHW
jgi:hypothetical protein